MALPQTPPFRLSTEQEERAWRRPEKASSERVDIVSRTLLAVCATQTATQVRLLLPLS